VEDAFMGKKLFVLALVVILWNVAPQAHADGPGTLMSDMQGKCTSGHNGLQSGIAYAVQYYQSASSYDPYAIYVYIFFYYAQIYCDSARKHLQQGDTSSTTMQYLNSCYQFCYQALYYSFFSCSLYGFPHGNYLSYYPYIFIIIVILDINSAMNDYQVGHESGYW
jgi:hypothetical protein